MSEKLQYIEGGGGKCCINFYEETNHTFIEIVKESLQKLLDEDEINFDNPWIKLQVSFLEVEGDYSAIKKHVEVILKLNCEDRKKIKTCDMYDTPIPFGYERSAFRTSEVITCTTMPGGSISLAGKEFVIFWRYI